MRRVLISLSFIICAHLVLATGTTSHPLQTECPTITLETPSDIICPLARVTFTASVSGDKPNSQRKFHWTVSSGKIISGQGTAKITLATADEYDHSADDFTATVEVVGLNASCSNTASHAVKAGAFCPERKFDEYGDLSFDEEKVRLESFINRLQRDTDTFGLIVFYAAQHGRVGEAEARAERARNYLVNLRGIEADRVITKDGGGSRESLTVELWVMPTMLPPGTHSSTPISACRPLIPLLQKPPAP
jgi:hypothetical protein